MTPGFLQRMERITAALVVVGAALWAALLEPIGGLSLAIGGVLALVNFRILRTQIGKLLLGDETAKPAVIGAILAAKFFALALVLYLLVSVAGLPPIPLVIGLSSVMPAMLLTLAGGINDIDAPSPPSSHAS